MAPDPAPDPLPVEEEIAKLEARIAEYKRLMGPQPDGAGGFSDSIHTAEGHVDEWRDLLADLRKAVAAVPEADLDQAIDDAAAELGALRNAKVPDGDVGVVELRTRIQLLERRRGLPEVDQPELPPQVEPRRDLDLEQPDAPGPPDTPALSGFQPPTFVQKKKPLLIAGGVAVATLAIVAAVVLSTHGSSSSSSSGGAAAGAIVVRSTCQGPCSSEDAQCNFTFDWSWAVDTTPAAFEGQIATVATTGFGLQTYYDAPVHNGMITLHAVDPGSAWGGNQANGCYVPGVHFTANVIRIGDRATITPAPPS